MRLYRTAVSAALFLGAATAWTPNYRPVKPAAGVANKPMASEFNPFHWAATGFMAASLAFTPLPSHAAEEGTVTAIPPAAVVETIAQDSRGSNADISMTIAEASNADISMTIAEAAKAPVAEAPKPVEAKKEEPKPAEAKKDAPKPVEAKKEEPKPVEKKTEASKPAEAKKEEPKPVEAKKEAPKTAPAPIEKKVETPKAEKPKQQEKKTVAPKQESKKAPVAKAAKKESKKDVKLSNKKDSKSPALALGVGVAAAAAVGIGLSKSAGRDYSDPIRNTNSNDSNAPYSYDTYASGSYSDGLPTTRRRRYNPSTRSSMNRTYRNGSNPSRNTAPEFATPLANSNSPYSEEVYSRGSYSDGLPKTTGNRYRPKRSNPSRSRDSAPPEFATNIADSNVPYSEDRYSSGSYASSNDDRRNNRNWSNPLRNSRSERRTIPSDNSNAPYSHETYASGSYSDGYSSSANRNRQRRSTTGGSFANGFPRANTRNEPPMGADTVRKNGSVGRYLGDDAYGDPDDGYNPKEPW